MSQDPGASQTAEDFIASQLQLEADAREALPYQFDTCTKPLGPLRQSLFSCLTCNPPPSASTPSADYTPAGLCYSCSISCHGEHDLVELFTKRSFVCDCGTSRIASSAPCALRLDPTTGEKGAVAGEAPDKDNTYNHNFAGRFCACADEYDPAKEKGTMFQCLGLGTVDQRGCAEDWWHPECIMGLPRTLPATGDGDAASAPEQDDIPLPPGFPPEDDFDHFICYKCVQANPWLKQYAGTPGFLDPVPYGRPQDDSSLDDEKHVAIGAIRRPDSPSINKRKAEDERGSTPDSKKVKVDDAQSVPALAPTDTEAPEHATPPSTPKHAALPSAPEAALSLFLKQDFRDHFCRCPDCFPRLAKHPQLLEEEESYEPPLSESDAAAAAADDDVGRASVGSGSTYERGEALLSNVDRVRAIEGVMVYNQLRDKVKAFLQPFAESGQAVGAEDIKAYFEKLRGDDEAIKLAAAGAPDDGNGNGDGGGGGRGRKEQDGY
ncbi:hypothetical protein MBLNU459_g7913t1 [Dothideomycetes sp. NU459]